MFSSLAEITQTGAETRCSFDFLTKTQLYDHEKPYYFSGALEPEQENQRTNLSYTTQDDILLKDLRGQEHKLSLENHGFTLLHHESKVNLVEPSDAELEEYLNEISALVKSHTQAELVLAYNYRFRTAPKLDTNMQKGYVGTFGNQDKPVLVPHTDQTVAGGPRRVRHHLSEDEAAKYMDGNWRIRILNCWRPLHHSADERPLAMCDFYSIDKADLRPADRASREYVGEIYYLHYNEGQKWYWISEQKPDEVTLFVNYDSDPGDSPAFMAHSSFLNKTIKQNIRPRESLETALIVISRKSEN